MSEVKANHTVRAHRRPPPRAVRGATAAPPAAGGGRLRLRACCPTTSCPGGPPAAPLPCLQCVGGLLSRPSASISPPPGETFRTYGYDDLGNRLTEASDAGSTTYLYDAADRLTTATAPGGAVTTYTFDANGNQLSAGPSTFSYDAENHLRTATVGSTTETYLYGGDGVRRSASAGSQANKTTKFLWDRTLGLPQLAMERNGNDALLRTYAYGLDLVSQKAGNKTYYYHQDGLGSVADVTGSTGSSLIWNEYYPFGVVRRGGAAGGAPVNPFGFTGEQRDAVTGFYHLRARQYDPSIGRFLTGDPVAAPISDPYVSSYVYVRNAPLRYADPSGECLGLLIFLLPACIGAGGYIVGTIATNLAENLANGGDPFKKDVFRNAFDPTNLAVSAIAGQAGAPFAGLTFTPTRIAAGAALGCSATFASQVSGGREADLLETGIGCVAGGAASAPRISSQAISGAFGLIVAGAQSLATWVEQQFTGEP